MKKKQKDELKSLNQEGLTKKLVSFEDNLRTLKFKTQGSKSKNVKELKNLKRNIARVLTEITKHNKKD